jgi:acyl dehydratase
MADKVLSGRPTLAPMFVKSALTGALRGKVFRGKSLPDAVVRLPNQSLQEAQLLAYDRVCGFRYSDVLPPTYLHVLAFPLSVVLMSRPSFPLPLAGLVHVTNSITAYRPVSIGEKVSFAVRTASLRPHPAGTQFDVLADLTVGTELVWQSSSTYLSRGAGSSSSGADKPADRHPAEQTEPPDGAFALVRVPEDTGRRYAEVSGDHNPIHPHSWSARAFGFKSAIVHGMWLAARTLSSLEGRLPEASRFDVRFKTPVFLPSTVSITSRQDADGSWETDVRNSRSGKPHLSGTVRAL